MCWGVPGGASQDNALSSLNRLAEKYRECLSSKEKILKEIEVKKEYLSSLQPRLNSIMQVRGSPQPATSLALTGPPPPSGLGPPAAAVPCGWVCWSVSLEQSARMVPSAGPQLAWSGCVLCGGNAGRVGSGTHIYIHLGVFTQRLSWVKHFHRL